MNDRFHDITAEDMPGAAVAVLAPAFLGNLPRTGPTPDVWQWYSNAPERETAKLDDDFLNEHGRELLDEVITNPRFDRAAWTRRFREFFERQYQAGNLEVQS